MRRTRSFRRSREGLLFFFIKAYDKEISASTISRWIVDTVRFAYDQPGFLQPEKFALTRNRALSSSLAWLNYVPLDTVLRAVIGGLRIPSLSSTLGTRQVLTRNCFLLVLLW